MRIVIHHNPECGTSRTVLERVRAAGFEPDVIEYIQTGWTRGHLLSLLAAADMTAHAALRRTHDLAQSLNLLGDDVPEQTLIDAMLEHPVLVNRPFVVTARGVRLCRPPETVDDLL